MYTSIYKCSHTNIYKHIYKYTCTHIRTQAQKYAHIQSHLCAHTNTYKHIYTNIQAYTSKHTRSHTQKWEGETGLSRPIGRVGHILVYAHIHTCKCTHTHICNCICLQVTRKSEIRLPISHWKGRRWDFIYYALLTWKRLCVLGLRRSQRMLLKAVNG